MYGEDRDKEFQDLTIKTLKGILLIILLILVILANILYV